MNNSLENIWSSVWKGDSYSESKLRNLKAKQKVIQFEKELNLATTDTCVDLGCGGGYVSQEIFSTYGCNVIGVDFSTEAISLAKRNFEYVGSKCNFIVGSTLSIPLPDNSADAVLCIGLLEHVKDITVALNEIGRILKNNASIVIISSNLYSTMYIDRIIKQACHVWKYGYQKNWTCHRFCKILSACKFETCKTKILQGFGDFDVKNSVDVHINKVFSQWGRYFMVVGRNKKDG